jgi:hypothetical protein
LITKSARNTAPTALGGNPKNQAINAEGRLILTF